LRSIPADLEPQAVILKRAACSPMKIFLYLSRECQRFNRAVTFTRKDVYNILRCQASQISLYTHEETTDINSQGDKIYIVSINSTLYHGLDRTLATSQRAMDYGLLEPGAPKHQTSVNECSCQFEKCFGIPCRHRFYIMLVTGYSGVSDQNTFRDLTYDTLNSSFVYCFSTPATPQQVTCDRFWYKRSHEERRPVLRFPSIQQTGVSAGRATKAQRRQQLLSTFGTVADLACCTKGKTKDLIEMLTEHMDTLVIAYTADTISQPLIPLSEPPTVVSTVAAAREPEDDEDDIPLGALERTSGRTLVLNPANQTNQKQGRIQPSAAPTSRAYKIKGKEYQRTREVAAKTDQNKNQGKTKDGRDAY
jgi:hypothetical protein